MCKSFHNCLAYTIKENQFNIIYIFCPIKWHFNILDARVGVLKLTNLQLLYTGIKK